MKVRIRKAGPGEKPRFVSKLNNLIDKAKGGKTAAVENFIESEIENGSAPEDVISKLESFNIKGDAVDSLVYDAYDRYQDDQNYYNAKKEKAPYEEPAPYEEETEEEPDNSQLYDYNSKNIGLEAVNEGADEEDEEEYANGGQFVGNSIIPKAKVPYFIGLDAAPFDSQFANGGTVPSKSKFVKSYMKQLKKAAEGDQVNNSEFYLPPTGTINDPMGNTTKQNQMFAGAVKQIGNEAMMQKQAEEAYQNMFTKAAGGSQDQHDWIDELHGYGESLQHAMPNMDQNKLNSFIMKDQYARGGRVRRANKALFGTPFAIPGVDVSYEFGPLGGMRKATADWDVQALGNLVNFLPGGMNMLPGMMSSGWKSVSYPAQVRKKVIQSVNNKALDEVAGNTPGSDATQKQKSDKKKQLTCPPGSFYDAAKDMCVDMNGIPMPSKIDLPTVDELMVNPWSRGNKQSSEISSKSALVSPMSALASPITLGNTSIDQRTFDAIKDIQSGDMDNRYRATQEFKDTPEYKQWLRNDNSTPEENNAMVKRLHDIGYVQFRDTFLDGSNNKIYDYEVDVDGLENPYQQHWNIKDQFGLRTEEDGGYVDQSIIDPANPMLMKFIYGGDDQYAMGGNILPKADKGFEQWAKQHFYMDGTSRNKPNLSYEMTNPWNRKNPLDLPAPTVMDKQYGIPGTSATAPNPTPAPNQQPGPVQPPNQNQTINPQQFSPQQMQQYMQQMQAMGFGRPQRLGFGLSRDFNYTQGFSPNWNLGEDTKHLRQETYKDRGKWYNPFDTKKITDWYKDPVTGESKPQSETGTSEEPNAAGPENAPGYNPNAAGPGYSGYNADSDGNNIPDYLQADGDMAQQGPANAPGTDASGKTNTEGLSGRSARAIRRGERKAERQTARGNEQFPNQPQEGDVNPFAKQPAVDFSAPGPRVNPDVTVGNQGTPVVGATNVTYDNPIKDNTNIVAGAGSGTGNAATDFMYNYQNNPEYKNTVDQAAANSNLNPTGNATTDFMYNYQNNEGYKNTVDAAAPKPAPSQPSGPQLTNPGLANPYQRPNPLALPTPSLKGRDGGFIPSYMAYMAYGGDIPMGKNGITVDQPEFSDPNFVGRTIEQSAYTFDPKQLGADLFRGPASIFGMATNIGNAINNEKNILDPARKQYRTSDAATANTGQSGFGSAEVTGSQMGDKGWYNQWGKNIENVGFEGNEVNTKMGGTGNKQYQKGRVYTLTLEQIKAIEAAGGKVEYLK